MAKIFQILAVVLIGIAAYFLWADNQDWAFACFVFGVCSYFFGMRFQLKARIAERRAAEEPQGDPDQT